ncbi:MAG TPA: SAM-dependent methyltransferase [Solirubrobacterales bacterium]|jgi:SAM-dependent methyltransferase|nr:SAM-dependent methyltransferase [Solirubrobacterales bacterium]
MSATRDRAPVEHFERLARDSSDPWGYATSSYEQAKYRRTLAHLPKRIGSALELGCSVGVFTAMLAPRCDRLLAVDFSPTALAHARERVGDRAEVEFRQALLPEETPRGPFSAIVCSEILYYWSPELVRQGLRLIESALAPGGILVAVHWRPSDPRRGLDGDAVHAILRAETGLHHRREEADEDFLLDSWERGKVDGG